MNDGHSQTRPLVAVRESTIEPTANDGRGWESRWWLYAILIVMPVTGWIMSSALNLPVVYLGLVHIPSPFGVDSALGETMKVVHLSLAVALLVLVTIHVLAALYHHRVLRDDVLRRMLPWPARPRTQGRKI